MGASEKGCHLFSLTLRERRFFLPNNEHCVSEKGFIEIEGKQEIEQEEVIFYLRKSFGPG
jgi:hypothetical protein